MKKWREPLKEPETPLETKRGAGLRNGRGDGITGTTAVEKGKPEKTGFGCE